MVTIQPRAAWGFPGWARDASGNQRTPASVADGARTEWYVHYEGGTPTTDSGAAAMRSIHAGHIANGWSGIGYHFVIFQDGSIWEGRGWGYIGAHCPNHNTSGWGVQIHVGGAQGASNAALAAMDDLYDEGCRRAGRTLGKFGHRDGYATECPGSLLYSWVRAGMPRPDVPPTPAPTPAFALEDDMLLHAISDSPDGAVRSGMVFHASPGVRKWLTDGAVVGPFATAGFRWADLPGDVIAKQWPDLWVHVDPIDPDTLAAHIASHLPPAAAVDVTALANQLAPQLHVGITADEVKAILNSLHFVTA